MIIDVLAVASETRHDDRPHSMAQCVDDAARAAVDDDDPSGADQGVELSARTPLQPPCSKVRKGRGVPMLDHELFIRPCELRREPDRAREGLTVRPEDDKDHSSVPAYSPLRWRSASSGHCTNSRLIAGADRRAESERS